MTDTPNVEKAAKNFSLYLFFFCLIFAVLEICSFFILRFNGVNPQFYPFTHIVSGYYVFKNTPGSSYIYEVKENPNDPPTIMGSDGFTSNNPVTLDKPEGTIRIFLMGGSAAVGTGQFPPYSKVYPYRHGPLSYSLGPAGQLEHYLESKRPDLKFEVVNAASVDRTLHQSMIYYLETVSRFNPDIVINMDGYNDLFYGMVSGRPYAELESRLEHYVNLINYVYAYKPNLLRLLEIGYNRYLREMVSDYLKEDFFYMVDMDQEQYSFAVYKTVEKDFIRSSQRFFQIMEHYMAVLKSDNVDFIFALQPMLYRQINKEWSEIEDKMRRTVFSMEPTAPPNEKTISILMSKFFYDQYLSQNSRNRVEKNRFGFLDMNEKISHLKSDFELYIDYCHFTKEGSSKVAEILGIEVLKRLEKKQNLGLRPNPPGV
jgi:hypothetical protein